MAKKAPVKKKAQATVSAVSQMSAMTNLIDDLLKDGEKFDAGERGWNPAGTRIRKGMQELTNMAKELRKAIQEKKNSMKE